MKNTWKIYMLTLISFFVGTSQFGIVGMLDKIAKPLYIVGEQVLKLLAK